MKEYEGMTHEQRQEACAQLDAMFKVQTTQELVL